MSRNLALTSAHSVAPVAAPRTPRLLLVAAVLGAVSCGCAATAPSNATSPGASASKLATPTAVPVQTSEAASRKERACSGAKVSAPRKLPDGALLDSVPEGVIAAVHLRGLETIAKEELLSLLETRAEQPIDRAIIGEDIKRLWATGKLDDVAVAVSSEGGRPGLVFEVVERPRIGELYFVGLRALGVAGAQNYLQTEPGQPYDPGKLFGKLLELRERYSSLGFRRAQTAVSQAPATAHTVDVCIRIDEGPRARISRIDIVGNHALSDEELLSLVDTQSGQVNMVGGTYADLAFERDVLRMAELYYNRGMISVEFAPIQAKLSEDGRRLELRVAVDEGPVYHVGQVRFDGALMAHPRVYRKMVPLSAGDVVDRSKLQTAIERIVAYHTERNRPGTTVTPLTDVDPAKKSVDITFRIEHPSSTPP